ncbi:unnamed protein product [Boreogadus saida]
MVALQCCDDVGLAVLQGCPQQPDLRIQDNISRENRIGAMNPGIEFHVVPCAVSGQIKDDHSLPGEPRDQQSAFCILIPFIFNQSWNSLPLFLFRPLSCSNLPSSSSVICPALASPPWQPGTT